MRRAQPVIPFSSDSPMMTVKEAAKYLRVSTATIYRELRARALPAFRVGREWRFRREDINRWTERREKA